MSWGSPAAGPSPPGESASARGRLPRPEAPGEDRNARLRDPNPGGVLPARRRPGREFKDWGKPPHLRAPPAGPCGRPAWFPAAARGAMRPPWRRLGAPAQSPRSTRPGVPERRGGVVRPRRDGRVSRTDGRWPRSRSRGGRGRPRGGRLGQAPPPRNLSGRGRARHLPGTSTAPRGAPANSVGHGGSRPLGRRGGTPRRPPAAGRADGGAGGKGRGRGSRSRRPGFARDAQPPFPPLPSPPPQRRRNATPRLRLGARPAGDEARGSADATWLILPVVICLSQRLSHACASISNRTKRNCEWLIKSVIVYLIVPPATRITVVILELIRARNRDFGSGVFIGLENRRPPPAARGRGGEPRGESR